MQKVEPRTISSLDYEFIKQELGTIHFNALPATGAQLHGDLDHELFGSFLMAKEMDPTQNQTLEAYSLVEATPLYMGVTCRTTCRLHVYSPEAEYDVAGSQIIVSGNRLVYIAPPCFKLHNDFEVGEIVNIMPDKHVVLKCVYGSWMPMGRKHIIHEFYTRLENEDTFFVLETGFRVVKVIAAVTEAGKPWKAYELEHEESGFRFYMHAAMMCRKIEIIPFIN